MSTEPIYTKPEGITYPAAPWQLKGSLWVSLFKVTHGVNEQRPAGIYGAAFVSYEEGPLTYSELLVARPLSTEKHGRRVNITDIWVDSPESVAGGRELWAIPKGLCDFTLDASYRGPLSTTDWSARVGSSPIASATFSDIGKLAPRLPFRTGSWQARLPEGGGAKLATMKGTAKMLPCRGRWDFAADGPLGWLRGARPLLSARMTRFNMSFG